MLAYACLLAYAMLSSNRSGPEETIELCERFGNREYRHAGGVTCIQLNAKGTRLVTGGRDGFVRLWDLTTNKESMRISTERRAGLIVGGGGDQVIYTCFLDGEDKILIVCASRFFVWDFNGNKEALSVNCGMPTTHPFEVATISTDQEGIWISDKSGAMMLYSTKKPDKILGPLLNNGPVGCLAVSPDNSLIVAGEENGKMTLWNARTGERLKVVDAYHGLGRVAATEFTPDGKHVLTGSVDGTIHWWELKSLRKTMTVDVGKNLTSFVLCPSKPYLAAGSWKGGFVYIWDIGGTPKLIRTLQIPSTTRASRMSFSNSGEVLAASDTYVASVWDTRDDGKLLNPRTGHDGPVIGAMFGKANDTIVTMGADGRVCRWTIDGRKLEMLVRREKPRAIYPFCLHQSVIAFAEDAGVVALWSNPEKHRIMTIDIPEFLATSLALSQDGKRMAIGGEKGFVPSVNLYDLSTQKPTHVIPLGSMARRLCYSPDGAMLLIRENEMVSIWSSATGRKLLEFADREGKGGNRPKKRLRYGFLAEFAPDSRSFLSDNGEGGVTFWDAISGKRVHALGGGERDSSVMAIAQSPDGRRIATGSPYGDIVIWDRATWSRVAATAGHDGKVNCLEFAADGTLLVSGGEDTTAAVWRIKR